MPTVQPGLTVKSLAEVAWLVSRVGRRMVEEQIDPSSNSIRDFWQNTRRLQRDWDSVLGEPLTTPAAIERFQEVAAQLLTTELLVRVWSTILGLIDQRTGRLDLTRIAINATSGLLQNRNKLLSTVLAQPTNSTWLMDLDRLRRRCDRWTDLLIGNICGSDECFQFAFDPDRARDFAEEARDGQNGTHPIELLLAAGVRLSFLGHLPEVALDSAAFDGLIQAILSCIPQQAFQTDGSLRTRPIPSVDAVVEPKKASEQDVLLPGLTLKDLHRRFS
jgi:hypothetical protein